MKVWWRCSQYNYHKYIVVLNFLIQIVGKLIQNNIQIKHYVWNDVVQFSRESFNSKFFLKSILWNWTSFTFASHYNQKKHDKKRFFYYSSTFFPNKKKLIQKIIHSKKKIISTSQKSFFSDFAFKTVQTHFPTIHRDHPTENRSDSKIYIDERYFFGPTMNHDDFQRSSSNRRCYVKNHFAPAF